MKAPAVPVASSRRMPQSTSKRRRRQRCRHGPRVCKGTGPAPIANRDMQYHSMGRPVRRPALRQTGRLTVRRPTGRAGPSEASTGRPSGPPVDWPSGRPSDRPNVRPMTLRQGPNGQPTHRLCDRRCDTDTGRPSLIAEPTDGPIDRPLDPKRLRGACQRARRQQHALTDELRLPVKTSAGWRGAAPWLATLTGAAVRNKWRRRNPLDRLSARDPRSPLAPGKPQFAEIWLRLGSKRTCRATVGATVEQHLSNFGIRRIM